MEKNTPDIKNILKIAGIYVASLIGAGFATGQEILQFFSSYGSWSLLGVAATAILHAAAGALYMKHGYETRLESPQDITAYYFGPKYAKGIEAFLEIFLYSTFFVMISGSGTILSEFFGFTPWSGRIFMALLIFITSALGLKRFSELLGMLGPVLMFSALFVGFMGASRGSVGFLEADAALKALENVPRTNGGWLWSSILYCAFNELSCFYFLFNTGRKATGKREVVYGGVLGGILLSLCILLLNYGILRNITDVYSAEIPAILIAQKIGSKFSVFYSVLICVAIYGVAIPQLWSVSRHFGEDRTLKSISASFVLTFVALLLSRTDFKTLVATIYPIGGYIGIILLSVLFWKEIQERRKAKQ